ncbi:MAG: PDZ domain-containing protein [Armatimonadetes bacterium]|nr:PDZ domain-containing protein [Armatimonadota bacterium]
MVSLALALALLQGDVADARLMRSPDIHGDRIVFTYASDLWLADRRGGVARRLTSHPGMEMYAKFSPDGTKIAFTGSYEGNADVYVMPAEGGEPQRVTFGPEGDKVLGWTPDGKIAYASTAGSPGYVQPRLWLVSPEGGMPIPTKIYEISDGSFSPDGKKIAYNRVSSHQFNWRRYRGGTQGRISIWDTTNDSYTELPSGRENSWIPMWVGDSIYYISDRNQNAVNLYRYDTKTRKTEQITRYADFDVRLPSTDGKSIVFELGGKLMVLDLATRKVETVAPMVLGDKILTRPALRRLSDQIGEVSVSPSGARVVVEARGELFSVPAKNGITRNLTDSTGSREGKAVWAPDGSKVYYLGDASGEYRIYEVPQMGGEPKMLATDPSHRIERFTLSPNGKLLAYSTVTNDLYLFDLEKKTTEKVFNGRYSADNYDWSPDSKWIAYIKPGDNLLGAVYLYNVEKKQSTQVTEGYYNDQGVAFDANGQYLYLLSARNFELGPGDFELSMNLVNSLKLYAMLLRKDQGNPLEPKSDEEPAQEAQKPAAGGPQQGQGQQERKDEGIRIDLEGLGNRLVPLPVNAADCRGIVGLQGGVLMVKPMGLQAFSMDQRRGFDVLQAPVRSLDVNPKRTKIAFLAGRTVGVSDIREGINPQAAAVNTGDVEAVVDPRAEWRQMYWEAWRYQRDHFYDPNMLGLDWKAIGNKYAELLPFVAHREDLNYVLGLMIGELGTSHAYVGGGDRGVVLPSLPTGVLGADFAVENGKVKFARVFRGVQYDDTAEAPLGAPGVEVAEGEYLLAIDGKPVDEKNPPSKWLAGKVGKPVTLTVNKEPKPEGARKVVVKPIADDGRLRYAQWVEDNRRKVAEMSGGRIGYIHIPNTSAEGVYGLLKGFFAQFDKDALILDERFNGGGWIPTFMVERLAQQVVAGAYARNVGPEQIPGQVHTGPKVMLINQYAGSGGDMLPWLFRRMNLGPLIGMRTWGGLVGISGSAPLVDGGFLSSPSFGIFDPKTNKWIAENTGVDPDIEVDARPDLVAKGRDPQLEKAVEYLLEQLKKSPPRKKITAPEFPRVR